MFLKVSPWKKVMRFGRKSKLGHHFIGPYEVLEPIGCYRLRLLVELSKMHYVFQCIDAS